MRRVAAVLGVLAAVAGGLALSAAGGTSGDYRVDAIFDNASFLIPGQDVKIAGARVGSVVGVTLTPDNRARIQMAIDPRFTPFRSDADCTIQPQSLIGEKFIQCTPGTPRGSELREHGTTPPTVPLANTHAPVDIDLVLSTFRRPTNERLAIVLNELGSGVAARGDDINAAIRRANPALQETNRVLAIVDGDRRRLTALIGASHKVLGELARRRGRVKDFISSAASVTHRTAQRRRELGATVQRLPPLLREAQPSLRSLQQLADDGTPILRDLRASAQPLTRLARALGPVSDAARIAIPRVGTAARTGAPVLARAAPIVRDLHRTTSLLNPLSPTLADVLESLRSSGAVEGLQDFSYNGALATSRFDKYSHMLPAHVTVTSCSNYATTTSKECDAHFAGGQVSAKRRAHRGTRAGRGHVPSVKAPAPAATSPAAPTPSPAAPPASGGPQLKLPGLPPIKLPDLHLGGGGGGPSANPVKDLLDYLLR